MVVMDLPQIPFEVYDASLRKTVHVLASCNNDANSFVLTFDSETLIVSKDIMPKVNKAFDSPGITKIKICRK